VGDEDDDVDTGTLDYGIGSQESFRARMTSPSSMSIPENNLPALQVVLLVAADDLRDVDEELAALDFFINMPCPVFADVYYSRPRINYEHRRRSAHTGTPTDG
jgi:hypothetical protein